MAAVIRELAEKDWASGVESTLMNVVRPCGLEWGCIDRTEEMGDTVAFLGRERISKREEGRPRAAFFVEMY